MKCPVLVMAEGRDTTQAAGAFREVFVWCYIVLCNAHVQ